MTTRQIPPLPAHLRDQYRPIESNGWVGWLSRDFDCEECDSLLADPLNLFQGERVVRWYKNQRNRLAEIRWPDAARSGGGQRSVVLKSYESGSIYNTLRLLKGPPRAVRHWNNAWLLNRKGINTPRPVFITLPARGHGQGLIAVETAVPHQRIREMLTEAVEPETILGFSGNEINAAQFVNLCGQYCREIHDQSLVHRDFSGANILVPNTWDGTNRNLRAQFVMLDINRVREIPPGEMTIELRIQDLERLNVPDKLLEDYYSGYAGEDDYLKGQWQKFLKYRRGYRRIRESRNPFERAILKTFTYWPRTG